VDGAVWARLGPFWGHSRDQATRLAPLSRIRPELISNWCPPQTVWSVRLRFANSRATGARLAGPHTKVRSRS